jgi:hypothetical protein
VGVENIGLPYSIVAVNLTHDKGRYHSLDRAGATLAFGRRVERLFMIAEQLARAIGEEDFPPCESLIEFGSALRRMRKSIQSGWRSKSHPSFNPRA